MTYPPEHYFTGSFGVDGPLYVGGIEIGGSTVAGLPAAGTNGQVIYYTADGTNGIIWQFRYRAASASSFKWEFVGGQPLMVSVNNSGIQGTSETTASASYADLATVGPSVTPPLSGDYLVEIGCLANHASNTGCMSYQIGATGAADADGIWFGTGANYANHYNPRLKTGLTGGAALLCKYKTLGGTADYRNRWIKITPVRVG